MNTELFIAKKIVGSGKRNISAPIVRIAQIGVAAGVCVMLLSLFITAGFKREIHSRLSIFSPHIELLPVAVAAGWSEEGDTLQSGVLEMLASCSEVREISPYVERATILRGDEAFHGLLMHGVESPSQSLGPYITDGTLPDFGSDEISSEILLSEGVARALRIGVGDKVTAYFVEEHPRTRRLEVVGIYKTGFKDYDDGIALCDIRLLQQLNGWSSGTYSGVAITLNDIDDIGRFSYKIDEITENAISGEGWTINTIYDRSRDIFDWLELLDMNVWVILILLVIVSIFNMISSLIVIILEKAHLIATLNSMGMATSKLRRLFLWISAILAGKGLLWGNIAALLLALAQRYLHIISLDTATYYMEWVPISIQWGGLILLDISVMALTTIIMIIPTIIIAKIEPIKVLRFE